MSAPRDLRPGKGMRMSLPASARTPCRAGLQVFLTELALYSSSHRLRIEGGLVLYIRCNGALLQPCCLLSGCTLAALHCIDRTAASQTWMSTCRR